MCKQKIDCVCLQETIKMSFLDSELRSLSNGLNFLWKWSLAEGHSGGMLIGINKDLVDFLEKNKGVVFRV